MKHRDHFTRLGRWMAAAAAAVLSACLLAPAGSVLAEETESGSNTFDDGTLTYTILNSTEVSVTGCTASATHISIMPEIDGYDVVSIGEEAFANCDALQAVAIPNTVTEIGTGAFYGCTGLTSLTLPDAVTEIESGTFFGCSGLTELNLGNAVTSIGDMAFGYCSALTSLELPDTLETMGDQVFYYCTALESISIPEKVTELGGYSFYACLSLQEFHIPKNLENIGAMSFVACPGLQEITVEEGNPAYTVADNVLYNTEKSILYLYPAGRADTAFTVPDGVLVVYAGAFFTASNLQQLTLDGDLQYIGEMAFDFCSGLTSLTIPESVTTIGTTAFADCTGLTSVTFAGADDEDGGEGDDLEIGDYAFFCCDNLMEVQLPKRVSSIGAYAFGCTSPEDGDTSEDIVSVESESGDAMQVKALDGFLLMGYTGAASDYVKKCEVDLNFKSVNFNWAGLVFWVVLAAAVLVVIFVAVRIVRHSMMTAEEKLALREAKEVQKTPLSQRNAETQEDEEFDDGYRSIVDEEEEEAAPEIVSYDQTLSHGMTHSFGHADAEKPQDTSDTKE